MPRPTYNKEYAIPAAFDALGRIQKQIAYRIQIENGVRVRFCVGYQVRDPISGRLKDIVRYDDAGGAFHRHSAGFPPRSDHITLEVLPGLEFDYIEADLAANANLYEADAVRYGYEVEEDADDAAF
jgi:hypothetical protein